MTSVYRKKRIPGLVTIMLLWRHGCRVNSLFFEQKSYNSDLGNLEGAMLSGNIRVNRAFDINPLYVSGNNALLDYPTMSHSKNLL